MWEGDREKEKRPEGLHGGERPESCELIHVLTLTRHVVPRPGLSATLAGPNIHSEGRKRMKG